MCTLPVTSMTGSATSIARSGDAKISTSGSCTMRTVSPRSVSCVGQPASASSSRRACERQHAVAGAARRIDRERRGRGCSSPSPRCPRRRGPTAARRRGHSRRRRGRRRVGSATVPPTSRSTATRSRDLLELRRQQREKADVGPLDAQPCRRRRVARAHVGDLGVDVGAAAERSAHGGRELERARRSASCRPARDRAPSRTPARSPNATLARVLPPVSATAPRGLPMRSNSEPDS